MEFDLQIRTLPLVFGSEVAIGWLHKTVNLDRFVRRCGFDSLHSHHFANGNTDAEIRIDRDSNFPIGYQAFDDFPPRVVRHLEQSKAFTWEFPRVM